VNKMEVRYAPDPKHFERMNTAEVRQSFLVDDLFVPGELKLVYSDIDRLVIGSVVPTTTALSLEAGPELAADYFAQRREIGVFNIGGPGTVGVDGEAYPMANKEVLYIGRGSQAIEFSTLDADDPARFYLISLPAHTSHPTQHAGPDAAAPVHLGSQAEANQRTIYKYIHPQGIHSCQLVMGFTELTEGSIWNTMAAHTHERRSEVYMYFDLKSDAVVFHLMGSPHETRHIVVRDGQAVISPSWSIHAGAGTSNYCFVWAMGGENQEFTDMDAVGMGEIA
jgi:4-deoxy-L-threo-5-hexosulose-uronate ketol-isomerase